MCSCRYLSIRTISPMLLRLHAAWFSSDTRIKTRKNTTSERKTTTTMSKKKNAVDAFFHSHCDVHWVCGFMIDSIEFYVRIATFRCTCKYLHIYSALHCCSFAFSIAKWHGSNRGWLKHFYCDFRSRAPNHSEWVCLNSSKYRHHFFALCTFIELNCSSSSGPIKNTKLFFSNFHSSFLIVESIRIIVCEWIDMHTKRKDVRRNVDRMSTVFFISEKKAQRENNRCQWHAKAKRNRRNTKKKKYWKLPSSWQQKGVDRL